jgi:hypothetical protein
MALKTISRDRRTGPGSVSAANPDIIMKQKSVTGAGAALCRGSLKAASPLGRKKGKRAAL